MNRVQKMLNVSTAHLMDATMVQLAEPHSRLRRILAAEDWCEGWCVPVVAATREPDLFDDLRRMAPELALLMRVAAQHGCAWLGISGDGLVWNELPDFATWNSARDGGAAS